MRVAIFYFSLNPYRPNGTSRQMITIGIGHVGFIRTEQVEAADLSDALGMAVADPDECLMNTHPLDAEDWKDT